MLSSPTPFLHHDAIRAWKRTVNWSSLMGVKSMSSWTHRLYLFSRGDDQIRRSSELVFKYTVSFSSVNVATSHHYPVFKYIWHICIEYFILYPGLHIVNTKSESECLCTWLITALCALLLTNLLNRTPSSFLWETSTHSVSDALNIFVHKYPLLSITRNPLIQLYEVNQSLVVDTAT